jgi:hypothetical protein
MTHTGTRSAYENIRDAVISLGMEISEPILASLVDSVVVARMENKERLAIVDPVLLGLEAVAGHINSAGAASDPQAFSLLNELLDVYQDVTTEIEDNVKAQKKASGACGRSCSGRTSVCCCPGRGQRRQMLPQPLFRI